MTGIFRRRARRDGAGAGAARLAAVGTARRAGQKGEMATGKGCKAPRHAATARELHSVTSDMARGDGRARDVDCPMGGGDDATRGSFRFAARSTALSHLDSDRRQHRLALAKAPLHPVRKAPLEILGLIFDWCIELCWPSASGSPSDKPRDVLNRQRQPFLLAAVCRRWRHACHSYAPMWRTLDLRLDDILLDNVHLWIRYTTAVISLSARVAMHLRIFRARPSIVAVDAQLVEALLPMMRRCKYLVFCAATLNEPDDPLSIVLRCATPLLRGLYIRVGRTTPGPVPLLPDAPKLHTIDANYPFTKVSTTFPGAEIVSLASSITTHDLRRDDIAALQAACPNLDDLTLLYPAVGPAVRTSPVVLKMPVLRIKYSRPAASGDLLAFADQFSLPRIRSLRLYGDPEGSGARVAFLAAVFPQWRTLSKLTISTIAGADIDAFCTALADAPNLGALVLRKVAFTHATLHRLCDAFGRPTSDAAGTWLCPLLKNLDLFACTLSPDCATDDLVVLVARRLRAADTPDDDQRPTRLRRLYLPQGFDDQISARINELFS